MNSPRIFLPQIEIAPQADELLATILLVNDSPAWMAVVRRAFDAKGFALRLANDLEAAERQARDTSFDLVILDPAIASCDCAKLCRALRSELSGDVPILLLGDSDDHRL